MSLLASQELGRTVLEQDLHVEDLLMFATVGLHMRRRRQAARGHIAMLRTSIEAEEAAYPLSTEEFMRNIFSRKEGELG